MHITRTGSGAPLVLLHPGGTDSRALGPLVEQLADTYRLILPDRAGHGRTPDVSGSWSFREMATDTAAVIRDSSDCGGPVHVLGHSDGAIVGLHLALEHPDVVKSLVFVSGVFHHDGWLPGTLDGEPPAFMSEAYAAVSPDGAEHWAAVVEKSARLHASEPSFEPRDLAGLVVPVLILVGDDDEPRLEHVLTMYRAIPGAELAVVPRASHGVVVEKPELVASLVREFHRPDRGDGFAPIRRARG